MTKKEQDLLTRLNTALLRYVCAPPELLRDTVSQQYVAICSLSGRTEELIEHLNKCLPEDLAV